jgi:hypothetical protein
MATSNPLEFEVDRELSYCANLSQAAAQCDSLHSEIMKLRSLRKNRQTFDLSALQPLFSSHINESLAVGCSLASQASMSLQSLASEVRTSISENKRIESDLKTLHDLLANVAPFKIPNDVRVLVGNSNAPIPLSNFVSILKRHTGEWRAAGMELNLESFVNDRELFGDIETQDCSTEPASVSPAPSPAPSPVPVSVQQQQQQQHQPLSVRRHGDKP